jgi:hypothetical protein
MRSTTIIKRRRRLALGIVVAAVAAVAVPGTASASYDCAPGYPLDVTPFEHEGHLKVCLAADGTKRIENPLNVVYAVTAVNDTVRLSREGTAPATDLLARVTQETADGACPLLATCIEPGGVLIATGEPADVDFEALPHATALTFGTRLAYGKIEERLRPLARMNTVKDCAEGIVGVIGTDPARWVDGVLDGVDVLKSCPDLLDELYSDPAQKRSYRWRLVSRAQKVVSSTAFDEIFRLVREVVR